MILSESLQQDALVEAKKDALVEAKKSECQAQGDFKGYISIR